VPAFERSAEPNPKANIANAMMIIFFPIMCVPSVVWAIEPGDDREVAKENGADFFGHGRTQDLHDFSVARSALIDRRYNEAEFVVAATPYGALSHCVSGRHARLRGGFSVASSAVATRKNRSYFLSNSGRYAL
jgi:hypothetical protein